MSRFAFPRKSVGKIYIIENTLNDKVYIGLTISTLTYRFKKHIWNAIKNRSNSKLAVAIRELGQENFSIRLIKNCYSLKELASTEIYYIGQYDSLKNGYNSKKGGELGGHYNIPITVNGKKFPSIKSACRFYNIDSRMFHSRIQRNWSIMEALELKKREFKLTSAKPVIFRGIKYNGKKHLADSFNVDVGLFKNRLIIGFTIEEALGLVEREYRHPTAKAIVYKGTEYLSLNHLARAFGIFCETVRMRLIKGWTLEEALGEKEKYIKPGAKAVEVLYDGVEYNSYKELAKAHNVKYPTFTYRLNKGLSINAALGRI